MSWAAFPAREIESRENTTTLNQSQSRRSLWKKESQKYGRSEERLRTPAGKSTAGG